MQWGTANTTASFAIKFFTVTLIVEDSYCSLKFCSPAPGVEKDWLFAKSYDEPIAAMLSKKNSNPQQLADLKLKCLRNFCKKYVHRGEELNKNNLLFNNMASNKTLVATSDRNGNDKILKLTVTFILFSLGICGHYLCTLLDPTIPTRRTVATGCSNHKQVTYASILQYFHTTFADFEMLALYSGPQNYTGALHLEIGIKQI